MEEYLVGISYHDPESYQNWDKGLMEDYESSTGIFITAETEADAVAWGEHLSAIFFKRVNLEEVADWKSFGHDCWIENKKNSGWQHSYDFFQKINYGELPNFDLMGTEAYKNWLLVNKSDL